MEKTYKYLGYFLIALIPLTFAGFYKTYFGQFSHFDNDIDIFVHLHPFIASVWILMLIFCQPLLILNKKYALHRKLGKLSFVVFPNSLIKYRSYKKILFRFIISLVSACIFMCLNTQALHHKH